MIYKMTIRASECGKPSRDLNDILTEHRQDINSLRNHTVETDIEIAGLNGMYKTLYTDMYSVRVLYEKKLALMEQEHRMKISALKERMSIMGLIQAITAVAVIINYFI